MKLTKLGLSDHLLTFIVACTQRDMGFPDERVIGSIEEADIRRFATEADMAILTERMVKTRITFRPPTQSDAVWFVESFHDNDWKHICKTPEKALERLAEVEASFTMSHQWAGISKVPIEA